MAVSPFGVTFKPRMPVLPEIFTRRRAMLMMSTDTFLSILSVCLGFFSLGVCVGRFLAEK